MEVAGQKSQRMLEMTRLNAKIKGKREEIEQTVNDLGWHVYRSWEVNRRLEATPLIQESLQIMHQLHGQLDILKQELDDVRSSEMIIQEQETVILSSGLLEEGRQVHAPAEELPAEVMIYICPFCAHQVKSEASSCSHCQRVFYQTGG